MEKLNKEYLQISFIMSIFTGLLLYTLTRFIENPTNPMMFFLGLISITMFLIINTILK